MRVFRTLLFVLIAGLLLPSMGLAQESTTPPATTETPAEEPKPEVVPIPELSSRLAAAQLRLREIEESAAERADAELLLAEIEGFGVSVEERHTQLESRPIETYSLRTLEQTRVKWKDMGGTATHWEQLIADRLVELDGYDKEIEVMRASWVETAADPASAHFPQEITSQIAQLLEEVEIADKAVSERTEFVLSKQKHVTGFRVDINEVIKMLDVAADE